MDEKNISQSGELILLTLPIGNVQDITQRVLHHLQIGHFFAVEDTRVFIELLHRLGVTPQGKEIFCFHDHSPQSVSQKILKLIEKGECVYVASDAGSPIISDPAYPLITEAHKRALKVTTFPGPCSLIAALELAGLPPHPLHFYGFFPRERKKQQVQIDQFRYLEGTFVYFESPHRILETLQFLFQNLPTHCEIAIAREITKQFETLHRFKVSDTPLWLDKIVCKGEIVLLIYNPKADQKDLAIQWPQIIEDAKHFLEEGGGPKKLSKIIAPLLGKKASDVYSQLVNHSAPMNDK